MKIKDKLKEIRAANRIGLMGHIVASFPSYNDSIEAASGICEGGADLLEVQFPFSDPSADGPTIEGASYRALDAGFKTAQGFEIVRNLATSTKTAILIMTYGNIVYRYGVEKFVDKALECGAAGLIIPDFPPELDENLIEICRQKGLDNVLIAAPGRRCRSREIPFAEDAFDALYRRSARYHRQEDGNRGRCRRMAEFSENQFGSTDCRRFRHSVEGSDRCSEGKSRCCGGRKLSGRTDRCSRA